jgi:hypothetical protein
LPRGPIAEELGVDGGVTALFLVAAIAAAAAAYASHRKKVRKQESLGRLLAREPSLVLTEAPCGLDSGTLPRRFSGIPAGDRRRGVRYGVAGPHQVLVHGVPRRLECAAFQWWWEERRTQQDQQRTRTTYVEQRTTVALVRLPTTIRDHLVLRPESVLGRVGLTRGGHQLESSEFNRRFRVECGDRTLTLHLLDAALQELLVTDFQGRTIELQGDLLALVGRPSHRDPSLEGVVGELPAVRQDAARLLAAVPAAFWRAVGVPND